MTSVPSSSVPLSESSCIPSFSLFNFEDQRRKPGQSYADHAGNVTGGVYHPATGQTFGTVIYVKTNEEIRCSSAKLNSIFFVVLARIPARIFTLLTGDFIVSGCEFANRKWLVLKQKYNLESNLWLAGLRIGYSFTELLKNIIKIATYPIACVGLQLAAIYGMFSPNDGRLIFSTIEDLWARNFINITHLPDSNISVIWLQVTDYIGLCMQSKDVFDQKNLYRVLGTYYPSSPKTLSYDVASTLKNNREYFEKTGLPIDRFIELISKFYKEADSNEKLVLKIGEQLIKIKGLLEKSTSGNFENNIDKIKEEFTNLARSYYQFCKQKKVNEYCIKLDSLKDAISTRFDTACRKKLLSEESLKHWREFNCLTYAATISSSISWKWRCIDGMMALSETARQTNLINKLKELNTLLQSESTPQFQDQFITLLGEIKGITSSARNADNKDDQPVIEAYVASWFRQEVSS